MAIMERDANIRVPLSQVAYFLCGLLGLFLRGGCKNYLLSTYMFFISLESMSGDVQRRFELELLLLPILSKQLSTCSCFCSKLFCLSGVKPAP